MTKGGRNLVLMGVAAVVVSVVMTAVSVVVYHKSGDIYLDRSRPGYLPDEEELEEEEEENAYEFGKSGAVIEEILEEYLENLEGEVKALNLYSDPFNDEALSDKSLGF